MEVDMGNAIIVLVILAAVVLAVRSIRNRAENGCCGGSCATAEKVKVADQDESHYPYMATASIPDVHCGHCRDRIEAALNTMEGVWASVDVKSREAKIRMKQQYTEEELRRTIEKADYTVADIRMEV